MLEIIDADDLTGIDISNLIEYGAFFETRMVFRYDLDDVFTYNAFSEYLC